MYIYFKLINAVLTCEEYPQILSVDEMKLNSQEYICNKWEKNDNDDGTFTLSFKEYDEFTCDCDNSQYVDVEDYNDYDCYNCGRFKMSRFKERETLYLQNSGSMDIVWVKPLEAYFTREENFTICEVEGYPNIYKWSREDRDEDKPIFALHVKNNMLSDENIVSNINSIKEYCYIEFTEECV
jgi:hypothetical protein